MHLNNVGSLWLRRYAVFMACCTFGLVIAGALVASNDAALSVPDWPLSWGRLVPTLEGGIRYRSEEHTSELQSRQYLVCRLLLEKKKKEKTNAESSNVTVTHNIWHHVDTDA